MINQPNRKCFSSQDGHVDSLRALLLSENFIKPYAESIFLQLHCGIVLMNLHVLCV